MGQITERFQRDLEHADLHHADAYAVRLLAASGLVFDYLAPGTIMLVDDPPGVEREITELHKEGASDLLTYAQVAERLAHWKAERLVLDPVMVATSGATLLDTSALKTLTTKLLPLAALVTPVIEKGCG